MSKVEEVTVKCANIYFSNTRCLNAVVDIITNYCCVFFLLVVDVDNGFVLVCL